jgi:DNA polymerase
MRTARSLQTVRIALRAGADLEGFRAAARRLIARRIPPERVVWDLGEAGATPDLFGTALPETAEPLVLPRATAPLIEAVVCHSDPERYALLYKLIWRIESGERALLEMMQDPLVHRLDRMRKTIRRDIHKMHAFLRFRMVTDDSGAEHAIAWFEPEHYILDAAAPFFVARFRSLTWSILTPLGALHWDGARLTPGPAAARGDAPAEDACEAAWQGYFESTFNPARVNPALMRSHMPKKYWRNLPETQAVAGLIETAPQRVQAMIAREAAASAKRDPQKAVAAMARRGPESLEALNRIIAATEPLSPGADRAVLGEGPVPADIVLVGEQPGDQEEIAGRPFVGPAGQLLDRALTEAGIDRGAVYVTNAVKHFKFERRGKKRIHQKPSPAEISRYRWWLMAELDFVRPKLVIALGASAALALSAKALSVTRDRGPTELAGRAGFVTVHPSYLLRLPQGSEQMTAYTRFRDDLIAARRLAEVSA